MRTWALVVAGVVLVGLVALGLRSIQVPAFSADDLESASAAVDRMVEPSEEVIREDIAAYVAQGNGDAQRPVGGVDLVLTGGVRERQWRLLAFRTRDLVCSLLVVGERETVQHGCVGSNVIHAGQFIPQHTDGLYAGIVDESVTRIRARLGTGQVVETDTVASAATPQGRLFAIPVPGGADAKTFEVLDRSGQVLDSFRNPYLP